MQHRRPDLLSLANDLRERAEEVLARAETFHDVEAQEMMRTIAANYEKLARKLEHLAV
jgi:ubiquinone biosynthesis protein UbiJ